MIPPIDDRLHSKKETLFETQNKKSFPKSFERLPSIEKKNLYDF
jgi:hypothetical protein